MLEKLVVLIVSLAIAAYVSAPMVTDHAFSFDAISNSPGVELIDYRSGDSQLPGVNNPEDLRREGKTPDETSAMSRVVPLHDSPCVMSCLVGSRIA
jgi:hypothetical protein